MRHADFSTPALAPTAPTASTRPTAAIGGGAGFAGMVSEVQGEVAAYIQNGDLADAGGGGAALSAEGAIWRARAAGLMGGETEVDGPDGVGATNAAGTPEQQAFLESIAPWASISAV